MKYILSFLVFFVSYQSSAELSFLPFAARFEGVGPIGGAGVRWKKDWDILAAGAAGAGTGGGLLASTQWGDSKFTIGGGGLSNVDLRTTYQRGIARDLAYQQNLSIFGLFTSLKSSYWSETFIVDWSLAISSLKINSFSDLNDNEINLGGANLQAINTYIFSPKFTLDFTEGENLKKSGISLFYRPAIQIGRAGLSDTLINSYGFKFYQPIFDSLTWTLGATRSDATVVAEKENYNSDTEVRDTLNATCSGAQECLELENELVNQILAENTIGTATPVGGAATLRGYREFRFKAKHTTVVNSELYWNVLFENSYLGLFGDLAYASDISSQLYLQNAYSFGAEAIYYFGDLPVRLGGAQNGEGDNVWYFTVGSIF